MATSSLTHEIDNLLTALPPTDDKPLSGSVRSFMAGVVSGNDSDRRKQPNPTLFQRLALHPPTRHEFSG
jgi:hypothetical protein